MLLETFTKPRLPDWTTCDRVTVQVVELFGGTMVGVHCSVEIVSPPSSVTDVLCAIPFQRAVTVPVCVEVTAPAVI